MAQGWNSGTDSIVRARPDDFGDRPDFVIVHNVGEKSWADMYDSRRYVVPAGSEGIVPREAACVWFGEGPHFMGDNNRTREQEYERVRARYGCWTGSPEPGNWEERRPKVTVREQDGTQWVLVFDDPQGESIPDDVAAASPSVEVQMAALQEQMRRLQSQLGHTGPPPATKLEDVPEDGKRRPGRPKQVKGQVPAELERTLRIDGGSAEDWASGQES